MKTQQRQVECTIPILPVSDLQNAIHFYTGTLGFTLDWGGQPGSTIASVSRDGCALMLSEAGVPRAWVWIGLEDEILFQEYRNAGVTIRQEPRNFSWAYEMKFEDPDGNVLWLGTEPRQDLPFEDSPT
jgi:catechol 2,3-dioxygenase-like lactoylglutathione lyase family enzyme